jgi:hypothetical protein
MQHTWKINTLTILYENLKKIGHQRDLDVCGRIILKYIKIPEIVKFLVMKVSPGSCFFLRSIIDLK